MIIILKNYTQINHDEYFIFAMNAFQNVFYLKIHII